MSDAVCWRPLAQFGPARVQGALILAGGEGWFSQVEELRRGHPGRILPAEALPADAMRRLTAPRPAIAGLDWHRPRLMGILNATPDSFSDGGRHAEATTAIAAGQAMVAAGADILDVGGESTRPGAETVPEAEEAARVVPVIAGLRAAGVSCPISVDTRKASVAAAAVEAGASLVNDVSGLTHDSAMTGFCAENALPVCVMHAQGDPATMQQAPHYDDVLLEVHDHLAARIEALEAAGIPRARIVADPGIGFGKTRDHNLALLARLSLFHALGVPVLLGASRKGFVGHIAGVAEAADRAAGSVGVAMAALGHGVQVLRVHDVAETRQAAALWHAATTGRHP
jgi:dihydropteroate synthase